MRAVSLLPPAGDGFPRIMRGIMTFGLVDLLLWIIATGTVLVMVWLSTGPLRYAQWPRVKGAITNIDITPDEARYGGAARTVFRVRLRYYYHADGKAYEGKWLHHHPRGWSLFANRWYSTYDAAERVAARYRPGTEIDVIHNPVDATEAFLEPSWGIGPVYMIVVFAGFLVAEMLLHGLIRF